MSVYTDSRVKASVTILANCDAKQRERVVAAMVAATKVAPKAPKATIAPKATPKAATIAPATPKAPKWHSERPSEKVRKRNRALLRDVNKLETALCTIDGRPVRISSHTVINGGKPCAFNGKAYSDHYYAMKALKASLKAELAAATR